MKRQCDKNITKQIRVDEGIHHLLKTMAVEQKTTIRSLAEDCFSELLAVEKAGVYGKTKNK